MNIGPGPSPPAAWLGLTAVVLSCGAPTAPAVHAAPAPAPACAAFQDEVSELVDVGFYRHAKELVAARADCPAPELAARIDEMLWATDATRGALALAPSAKGRRDAETAEQSARHAFAHALQLAGERRDDEALASAADARKAFERAFAEWARPRTLLDLAEAHDFLADPVPARVARERALALAEWVGHGAAQPVIPGALGTAATVVVTPDGKWAVAASDTELVLWDVDLGLDVHRFDVPGVRAIALDPVAMIAFVGGTRGIAAYDLSRRARVFERAIADGVANAIAFDDTTRTLAFAAANNVFVCSAEACDDARVLDGKMDWARSLAIHGGTVAALGEKAYRVWGPTGKPAFDVKHEGYRDGLAVSPSGEHVAFVSDGSAHVWSKKSGKAERITSASGVIDVTFAPTGELVLLLEAELHRLDPDNRHILGVVHSDSWQASAEGFDGVGLHVVASRHGGGVDLSSAIDGSPTGSIGAAVSGVRRVLFDPSGSWLAVTTGVNAIVWNPIGDVRGLDSRPVVDLAWSAGASPATPSLSLIRSGTRIQGFERVTVDALGGMELTTPSVTEASQGVSSVGAGFATALAPPDGRLSRTDVYDANGLVIKHFDEGYPAQLQLSKNARTLVGVDDEKRVHILDASPTAPERPARIVANIGNGGELALSWDGSLLAISNQMVRWGEYEVVLVRTDDGVEIARVAVPESRFVQALTFDRSGEHVVLGDVDGGLAVLDTKPPFTLSARAQVATGFISCMDASPRGARIAVGASDGSVRIWDLDTKSTLLTLLSTEGRTTGGHVPWDFTRANQRHPSGRTDTDWIAVSEDGRIDVSANGWDLVRFKIGDAYYPGLLGEPMAHTRGLYAAIMGSTAR